jgi:hypothetical protein
MVRPLPLVALTITIACALLAGCSDASAPDDTLQVPAVYPNTDFQVNATTQLMLLDRLTQLVNVMKEGRQGAKVEVSAMRQHFGILSGYTSVYGATVFDAIDELAKASGGTYDPLKAPSENGEGGVYGGRLFDENGLEQEQQIEKGLYAAMCYLHAQAIMQQKEITPADIDEVVAIFGAMPAFPNSDAVSVDPDRYSAKYAARRDKNDGKGFYTQFSSNARKARAAAADPITYQRQLQDAMLAMRQACERSQMATVVNYLYATVSKLSQTTVTDADRAGAMHDLSEAIGFIRGWKGLPTATRQVTDAQIESLLTLMKAPSSGPVRCYEFWQQPASTLADLDRATLEIKSIYGFTDADMMDFRQNWVSVQQR